jgi:hypothetical protein
MKDKKITLLAIILTLIISLLQTTVMAASLPARPTITYPSEDGIVKEGSITIRWNPVAGASFYKLAVKDLDENIKFINDVNIGNITSYTISSSEIKPGHSYRIALGAINVDGESWRECSFTVEEITPEPRRIEQPILRSPSDGAILDVGNVRIVWEEVEGAKGYIFALRDDTIQETIIPNTNVVLDTYYTIPSSYLTAGHKYRYAVRVENDAEKKWTLGAFKIKSFIENTPPKVTNNKPINPIAYKEVRYLSDTDEIYIRADLNPVIGQKTEDEWPIVWMGIYDEKDKKWLYYTRDINTEMTHLRRNVYEKYIPADYVPRNTNLKFVFFVDGYITQEEVELTKINTIITPVPQKTWNIRYNYTDDSLEVLVKPIAVKGTTMPNLQVVIYDENGNGKYVAHDKYSDLTQYKNEDGNYFRSWKLSELNLIRGETYKIGVVAKGFEQQWSKQTLKAIMIHKPKVNEWNIEFDSINQFVNVTADTSGIGDSFRILLYRKGNPTGINISQKLPDKYVYANYIKYSASVDKMGITYEEAYEYYLKVVNKAGDTIATTDSIFIIPVSEPKLKFKSNIINEEYKDCTSTTKSETKQIIDKINTTVSRIQNTSDEYLIDSYLSVIDADLELYKHYLEMNLKSLKTLSTELKDYQQFYLDTMEHAKEINRLDIEIKKYQKLLDEKRIIWKTSNAISKASKILDVIEISSDITNLMEDIENKTTSYTKSVKPLIDKGLSAGFGLANPIYSATYESFKFTTDQWAKLFDTITLNNFESASTIHSMNQLYCIGYQTVSTRGFRDGLDGKAENLQCVVDQIENRAEMKRTLDEMDKWWLHLSLGQNAFYTALETFRKTLDKEAWIQERQIELYRSNYEKGRVLREYMYSSGTMK